MKTISEQILLTLQKGREKVDEPARRLIEDFVVSQITDGGFVNKKGIEDIYYTAFGLLLSYIFEIKIDHGMVRKIIDEKYGRSTDLVQFYSYNHSTMMLDLMAKGKLRFLLNSILTPGRGVLQSRFMSFPHNDPSSPYSLLLRLSLDEDLGVATEKNIIDTLELYRASDGKGYSNTTNGKSTTNATVAALLINRQICRNETESDISFLGNLQDNCGGFYAVDGAPLPDLLSTSTALFTLNAYERLPKINPTEFIEAHWNGRGGFTSTIIDSDPDIEYTFYGLLALGATK